MLADRREASQSRRARPDATRGQDGQMVVTVSPTVPVVVEVPSDDLAAYRDEWDYDATIAWLDEHPGYLAEYEGQWVAFAGRTIVAHAPTYGDAVDMARGKGVAMPLMIPVHPPDELVV